MAASRTRTTYPLAATIFGVGLYGAGRASDTLPASWIAAAGPLASLGLALLFTGVWWLGGGTSVDSALWAVLLWLNILAERKQAVA